MPFTLSIEFESEQEKLELPDTTLKGYKFDYAEGDNLSKGHPVMIRLIVTIDVMEILSHTDSFDDNLKFVQYLRDWSDYKNTHNDSIKKYYRRVTLKNHAEEEEIRTLMLSHAYVEKATELFDPLKGKHTITLELMQRKDKLRYIE